MSDEHPIFTEYDWKKFIKGIIAFNQDERDWEEKYPLIADYNDNFDLDQLYTKFVIKAVNEENIPYQQCLEDLITTLLDGSRNADEGIEDVFSAIQLCLDNGAKFPQERLFNRRDDEENTDFVETVSEYHVRGKIIDEYHQIIDCNKFANWSEIEAKYAEDITDEDDYSGPTDINLLRSLKSFSNYLLEMFPNPKDEPSEF